MFTSSGGEVAGGFTHVSNIAIATLETINHQRLKRMRDHILERAERIRQTFCAFEHNFHIALGESSSKKFKTTRSRTWIEFTPEKGKTNNTGLAAQPRVIFLGMYNLFRNNVTQASITDMGYCDASCIAPGAIHILAAN